MAGFDQDVLEACAQDPEIQLTTYGRKSGQPRPVTIWIWGDGTRLYIHCGAGLARNWPRNLLADNRAILHVAGRSIPVRARHLTDPAEARAATDWARQKYGMDAAVSPADGPLAPPEQATFELLPDDVAGR